MKLKHASVSDLLDARISFVRLSNLQSVVRFSKLEGEMWLTVFTDASLGNLSDGASSSSGILVFLRDNSGNVCPLSWRANKIKRVVRSTLAAETLALQEGIDEGLYLRHLMSEILQQSIPIDIYVDHKGVVDSIRSTKLVSDRKLRIDIASLKETLQEVRSVVWVPGPQQLANCLTKKGASCEDLHKIFTTGKLN